MQIQITIDCRDAAALADFYCKAFGYAPEGSAGQYRSVVADSRPKLVFQEVAEPKSGKNRVHLDVIVGDDIEGVAERFVALGGTRSEKIREFGINWIVMHDPEGNEICICDS